MSVAVAGRIGPNAITRMGEALAAALGEGPAAELFERAGLAGAWASPPQAMVDEADVIRLHRAVDRALDPAMADRIARDAGRRTGDYLLANRIPRPVGFLLQALPAGLAAPLLLQAIGRHAWTFAGSGTFTARPGRPVLLDIAACPLCRGARAAQPCCGYYAATFERLFAVLVSPHARVAETACCAAGDAACRFEVRW
jgi:divinyl protochlorophyllide a 8-vinyl-reductase